MNNDYLFKVRTDGDIIDLEGRVIGHINLEYIKSIAESPQGEWVSTTRNNMWDEPMPCFECSVCGKASTHSHLIFEKIPYCPNCGAKMKGDAE